MFGVAWESDNRLVIDFSVVVGGKLCMLWFISLRFCCSSIISCLIRFVSAIELGLCFLTVGEPGVLLVLILGVGDLGALLGDSRGFQGGVLDLERRRRGGIWSSPGEFSLANFRGGIVLLRKCTSLL